MGGRPYEDESAEVVPGWGLESTSAAVRCLLCHFDLVFSRGKLWSALPAP